MPALPPLLPVSSPAAPALPSGLTPLPPPCPLMVSTPGGLLPHANDIAARLTNPNTHTLERTESSFGSHKKLRRTSNRSRTGERLRQAGPERAGATRE